MATTAFTQLGGLLKTFRESKGLTQIELARLIAPPINRSVISYLETGSRLPAAKVLHQICTILDVPEPLWESFLEPGIRRLAKRANETLQPALGLRHICVSGIMGSGKSTLARGVSHLFGYQYIGEPVAGLRYLADLGRDPNRWAFETQLAFLIQKSILILEALDLGQSVVVDRSISEDVNVFARSFYEASFIDQRSFDLYTATAEYFLSELPPPELIVFCRCSIETATRRIENRNRDDRQNHSLENMRKIQAYYDEWLENYAGESLVVLDSENLDWREPSVLQQIVREIESLMETADPPAAQFELFDSEKEVSKSIKLDMLEIPHGLKLPRLSTIQLSEAAGPLPYPCAYLAAPFTSVASGPVHEEVGLFDDERDHGVMGRGSVRQALLDIEHVLSELGFSSLIPHRDINAWGRRALRSDQVLAMCTSQVDNCNLFVGLLGESNGSHYELGLARGQGKPCIVVRCHELTESFIASGVESNNSSVLSISCDRLSQIGSRMQEKDVRKFLGRFFDM